ncbi:MAG: LysR family transcriptional regulator [Candidatus Latescibacteria bacterium]|nr:LysR family transcriptional regulator [Candidatus Latescibacterota bacterium]
MELYHLRTFITVAEEQNLTRAAQKLFTSPPSVSAHIKALEEELHVVLFNRTPKGMTLTSAGETLKEKARLILDSAQDLMHTAQSLRDEPAGQITFGLNIPPEWLRVSTLFECLHTFYPKINIEFVPSSTGLITEALIDQSLDVGCMYGSPVSNLITLHHLIKDELVIAAPKHWAKKVENATWEDLAQMPWIRDTQYCPFQNLADDLFKKHDLAIKQTMPTNDDATRLELVKGGAGMSILERRHAETSDQIMIWEIEEPLYSDLNFAHLTSRAEEPIIRAVTEQMLSLWRPESEIAKAG